MAKKGGGSKKPSSDRHKAPRLMVPLPRDVVDAFREWCEENRRVMNWEIAHLVKQFLKEQGRWPEEGGGAK
ncbi:MAG TPA: Arc family DNA-binding protein [Gemmataceae bacterium]|nr:Arc family DNA-binding protein [Gemmataceae bacterium]